MYSREFVSKVQQELQQLLPTSTVLLGGSYLANEATTISDLDLYIVAPILQTRKIQSRLYYFRQRYPDKKIRLMLIPKLAYHLGIYFCSGTTISGERKQSYFDRKTCVNNALKLALYYFLLARERESEECLKKAAQQAALACALTNKIYKLPLTNSGLLEKMSNQKKFPMIKVILAAKIQGNKISAIQPYISAITQELVSLIEVCGDYSGWNWKQYLLYNSKFLAKGEWLFCLRNPDTMLINQLRRAIIQPETWSIQRTWIKHYVFPVIML